METYMKGQGEQESRVELWKAQLPVFVATVLKGPELEDIAKLRDKK